MTKRRAAAPEGDPTSAAAEPSRAGGLTPIARPTVTDEIVKRLVTFILTTELRPGDKLPSERQLMVQLGVGRNSLREAIRTLAAVGIVEVAVGEGMFVGSGDLPILAKPLSWALLIHESTAREVIQARRLIEAELAALAASEATPEEVAAMRAELEAMRAQRGQAEGYIRHHLEFHLTIARAAHNRVLYHVLAALGHVLRIWLVENYSPDPAVQQGRIEEHAPILEAIAARSPQEARRAMVAHLEIAGTRLLASLARMRDDTAPRPKVADLNW